MWRIVSMKTDSASWREREREKEKERERERERERDIRIFFIPAYRNIYIASWKLNIEIFVTTAKVFPFKRAHFFRFHRAIFTLTVIDNKHNHT